VSTPTSHQPRLTLTSHETNADLPSPTALAFSALTGDQVQFYAATAGHENAALVALSMGAVTAPDTPAPAPPPQASLAQLVPLQESSLALVGTLLTVTIESPAGEINLGPAGSEAMTALAFSPGTAVSVGQGLFQQGREGTGASEEEETVKSEADAAATVTPNTPSWQGFVLGLDEALEQFDREHSIAPSGGSDGHSRNELPYSDDEAKSPSADDSSDLKASPGQLRGEQRQESTQGPGENDKTGAIDAVIASWWEQGTEQTWGLSASKLNDLVEGLAVALTDSTPSISAVSSASDQAFRILARSADSEDTRGPTDSHKPLSRQLSRGYHVQGHGEQIEVSASMVLATVVVVWVSLGSADHIAGATRGRGTRADRWSGLRRYSRGLV